MTCIDVPTTAGCARPAKMLIHHRLFEQIEMFTDCSYDPHAELIGDDRRYPYRQTPIANAANNLLH